MRLSSQPNAALRAKLKDLRAQGKGLGAASSVELIEKVTQDMTKLADELRALAEAFDAERLAFEKLKAKARKRLHDASAWKRKLTKHEAAVAARRAPPLTPEIKTPLERAKTFLTQGTEAYQAGRMADAERLGGALSLCAMEVPAAEFDQVSARVNAFPEVAHNYARAHRLNMWFVLATETPDRLEEVLEAIEQETGHPVYNMPKLEEFFVGLRFEV